MTNPTQTNNPSISPQNIPPSQNRSGSRLIGTRSAGTGRPPGTDTSAFTNAEITTLIAGDPGLIKDALSARDWLTKSSWLLQDEPCTPNKIANILLAASLTPKTPTTVINLLRACAQLLLQQQTDTIVENITQNLNQKLGEAINQIPKAIDDAKTFFTAASTQQAQLILDLQKSLDEAKTVTKNTIEANERATITQNDTNDHLPNSLPPMQHNPTYAGIIASRTTHPPVTNTLNTNAPEYAIRLENRLRIQEKQVYVTFSKDADDSPTDQGSTAAYKLRSKLNEQLRALNQETNQVDQATGQPIRALHFTERSALLIEFDSTNTAAKFRTYCNDFDFLSNICSTATIQPRTYRLIMKFVPCDGSFAPDNEEQLRDIETDHDLENGSLISASWIKKPERRSPNQKTAHVKLICATAAAANKLLLERVFISNARVVITKDIQEPLRCNKCQHYGHIREQCPNSERCATCAKPHPSNACTHPNEHHCVPCGTPSNHSSSDKNKCPQYAKHNSLLDTRLPENTIPYFPILGLPWTFAQSLKRTQNQSHNTITMTNETRRPVNEPTVTNPNDNSSPPPSLPNTSPTPTDIPNAPSQPRTYTQTTLDKEGRINPPPLCNTNSTQNATRPADNGWNSRRHTRGNRPPSPSRYNPNDIHLPPPHLPTSSQTTDGATRTENNTSWE